MGSNCSFHLPQVYKSSLHITKKDLDVFEKIHDKIMREIILSGWINAALNNKLRVVDTNRMTETEYEQIHLNSKDLNKYENMISGLPLLVRHCKKFPSREVDGKAIVVIFEDLVKSQVIIDCSGRDYIEVSKEINEQCKDYNNTFTVFYEKIEDNCTQNSIVINEKGEVEHVLISSSFTVVRPKEERIIFMWAQSIDHIPILTKKDIQDLEQNTKIYKTHQLSEIPIVVTKSKEDTPNKYRVVLCTETAKWTDYRNLYFRSIESISK